MALPFFLTALQQEAGAGTALFLQDISLPLALGLATLIGLTPLIIGMSSAVYGRRTGDGVKNLLVGVAFGAMIFFLVDVFEGASSLGVDFGVGALPFQTALVISFVVGLLAPSMLAPMGGTLSQDYARLAYLFALGIGFHSFAEGVVVGYDLISGYGFTLAQRILQALSFVLHKGAEGFAISIPLLFTKSWSLRVISYAVLIGGIPLIAGTALGFMGLSGVAASYFFAAGAGGVTYMLFTLAKFSRGSSSGKEVYLGIFLGLLYMYFAGVIHGIEV